MNDTHPRSDASAGIGSAATRALASRPHYYAFLAFFLVTVSALGSFVNDMYTPALPAMCRFFGCSVSVAQMGLTTGMIGLGLGQLILGPLSDRYGRKPVLLGSLSVFIAAAVASVFMPDIHLFNACRFLQGLGASGGYFLARTIPADIYSGRPLAKLMALTGAINGIAPASAPVIGGITADAWGWKGVFLVLAAFALIVLAVSPLMKESLPPSRRTQGKWWKSIKGYGALLRNRSFLIHICFKGVALGLLFGYISAAPFIIQTHYGMSQTQYGLIIGLNSVFMAAGSMIAMHFKPLKRAARTGVLILVPGAIALAVTLWTVHSLWVFEICSVPVMFGLGLIFTTVNTLAMNEGRSTAGEASALLGLSGYVVGATVAPLVGIGNVLHSSAIAFVALAMLILAFSSLSRRLAPDLVATDAQDKPKA